MGLKRHTRFYWCFLGTEKGRTIPNHAYVMDDFGSLIEIGQGTYNSLRAGCDC